MFILTFFMANGCAEIHFHKVVEGLQKSENCHLRQLGFLAYKEDVKMFPENRFKNLLLFQRHFSDTKI